MSQYSLSKRASPDTDWPTIPQLYIKGEFIGGADIVRKIYESGELSKLIENCKT